jgi:hypothetical protein
VPQAGAHNCGSSYTAAFDLRIVTTNPREQREVQQLLGHLELALIKLRPLGVRYDLRCADGAFS